MSKWNVIGCNMEQRATPYALNWLLFAVGMTLVWLSTHDWIPMLGALVASVHVSFQVERLLPGGENISQPIEQTPSQEVKAEAAR